MSNVVELNNAQFVWPGSTHATIHIPQLHIAQGEHVFIKGPSGCGKSTLLALLTGINTLTSGSLSVLNTDLVSLSASQRDKFRADHIGYIFQQFNLLPYLNVLENVLLPCQFSQRRASSSSAWKAPPTQRASCSSGIGTEHWPTTTCCGCTSTHWVSGVSDCWRANLRSRPR